MKHEFTISVTSDELRELQRCADFRGILITEYIKRMALAEAGRPLTSLQYKRVA
jgi:hypothetical protein